MILSTTVYSIDMIDKSLPMEMTGMLFDKTNNLDFTKVNDTKYRVRIVLDQDKTKIIFKQKYHPGGKLYIVKPQISSFKKNDSLFQGVLETWFPTVLTRKDAKWSTIDNLFIKNIVYSYMPKTMVDFFSRNVIQWPEEFHSVAYEYANGWILDKTLISKISKTYNLGIIDSGSGQKVDIIIEYQPQKTLYILYLLFAAVLAYSAAYLFIRGVKCILKTLQI